MEPEEDSPLVAKLRFLLNRSTKIEITDGRVFVGQFMCIDHSKNIILSGAYEYRPSSTKSESTSGCQDLRAISEALTAALSAGRSQGEKSGIAAKTVPPKPSIPKRTDEEGTFVGQVMIPGHHIIKAEMDCSHLRSLDIRLKAPTKFGMDYLRG
ncbi:hypothetical protein BGZ46_008830 [Entomortierella lignicola]|nr:hypothetical protein BGZ46_008830 [Entomortierella lignicola]